MPHRSHALTLLEVARELGRSLEQVRRYVREGKLPAQKQGMQWFVDPAALKRFIAGSGVSSREGALTQARELRGNVRSRTGNIQLLHLLDKSREEHP